MLKSGIYQILNKTNGNFYIGSAIYIRRRFAQHRHLLRSNCHPNRYLQATWNKYGEESFSFEILEYCLNEVLIAKEQFYIDWLKPKYNLNRLASSRLGTRQSKETIARMKEAFKGFNHSDETKIKISNTMKSLRSEELIRLKYSELMKGNDRGRDYKKWPCPKGSKCKCISCKDLRNADNRRLLQNKFEIQQGFQIC